MDGSIMKVSLVVPNLYLNQLQWFLKTNWSVLKPDIINDQLELIVVSSASKKLLQPVQKRYPKARIVNSKFKIKNSKLKNVGFAPTVNLGFSLANKDSVWLGTVNDDVSLPKGWLVNLIDGVKAKPQVGSINPVILNNSKPKVQNAKLDVVESAGIRILPIGRAEPITQVPNKPTKVDATNAACVLYNRQALDQVGFFDERFESYLEDIDLALRLTKAGYSHWVVPSVRVIHLKHATSQKSLSAKKRAYLNLRNWWFILIKNWPLSFWLRYLPGILIERGRNLSGWLKSSG